MNSGLICSLSIARFIANREAFKIFEEVVHDDELKQDIGPGTFYYHRYLTTNKYTIDDIYNNNIEPYCNDDLDRQQDFINSYIEKKLNN